VNLNGQIYSPTPYDGPEARTFRDENDRFLSNRENVEVYTANPSQVTQNGAAMQSNLAQNAVLQNAASQLALKLPEQPVMNAGTVTVKETPATSDLQSKLKSEDSLSVVTREAEKKVGDKTKAADASSFRGAMEVNKDLKSQDAVANTGAASEARTETEDASAAKAMQAPRTVAVTTTTVLDEESSSTAMPASRAPQSDATPVPAAAAAALPPPPAAPTAPVADSAALPGTSPAPAGGEAQTNSAPSVTVTAGPPPTMAAPAAALPTSQPIPAPVPPEQLPAQKSDAPMTGTTGGVFNTLTGAPAQFFGKVARNVVPQQMLARDTASLSNTVPEESDFRRVIGTETSGEVARFLEDKMRLLVWLHPSADAPIVFGAQLDQDKLVDTLKASFKIAELTQSSFDSFSRTSGAGFCAAILDDTGHPVALSRPGFSADWKHPFVATEIGEVLPHWEAALYLVDPQQFSRTARTLQWAFFAIVIFLIAAIVAGGSFIGRDVRREMLLAQQKTDFVSNVSHELKTPLTSIRMFADLLAEKRVPDEERQATYLRIIAAEASRLTRLINNVLDFARLEKGAPHGEHAACDLVEAARDVADTCGPHLEAAGVSFQCEIEAETLPIRGDRDALAQIILNLISNAEKYGGNDILVRVRRQDIATGALGCVDVLDRGAGIPARQVKTIFEPFHRLDDSLSSGIPGSGLGLTLARKMARVHGGDVTYSARAGGGSCFTLAVPLA
jgi:signal transduction histidine kinase